MIKVEVTKEFTLKDFDKLKNIVRKTVNEKGKLFVGDEFECDNTMFEYLTGNNPNEDVVVKLIEIIPEKEELHEAKVVEADKVEVKTTKKKKISKK